MTAIGIGLGIRTDDILGFSPGEDCDTDRFCPLDRGGKLR